MKTCPLCHSMCFDEVNQCFECLYVFDNEEGLVEEIMPSVDDTNESLLKALSGKHVSHETSEHPPREICASIPRIDNEETLAPANNMIAFVAQHAESTMLRIEIPWSIVQERAVISVAQ